MVKHSAYGFYVFINLVVRHKFCVEFAFARLCGRKSRVKRYVAHHRQIEIIRRSVFRVAIPTYKIVVGFLRVGRLYKLFTVGHLCGFLHGSVHAERRSIFYVLVKRVCAAFVSYRKHVAFKFPLACAFARKGHFERLTVITVSACHRFFRRSHGYLTARQRQRVFVAVYRFAVIQARFSVVFRRFALLLARECKHRYRRRHHYSQQRNKYLSLFHMPSSILGFRYNFLYFKKHA